MGPEQVNYSDPDLQAFWQTWFFFGLLAEFHGLNATPGHDQPPPQPPPAGKGPDADPELEALYNDFTVLVAPEGVPRRRQRQRPRRQRYLTGARLVRDGGWASLASAIGAGDQDVRLARMEHLQTCLTTVDDLVSHISYKQRMDPAQPMLLSIYALINYLVAGLASLKAETILHTEMSTEPHGYLEPSSEAERAMIAAGWCMSDTERIRIYYRGLSTKHFLCHMVKPDAGYSHEGCSRRRCSAAQIVAAKYAVSHADGCTGCRLDVVDEEEVKRILRTTDTFPILRLEFTDEHQTAVNITVEEYCKSKPYIALSHVCMGFRLASALRGFLFGGIASLTLILTRSGPTGWGTQTPTRCSRARWREWPSCCDNYPPRSRVPPPTGSGSTLSAVPSPWRRR